MGLGPSAQVKSQLCHSAAAGQLSVFPHCGMQMTTATSPGCSEDRVAMCVRTVTTESGPQWEVAPLLSILDPKQKTRAADLNLDSNSGLEPSRALGPPPVDGKNRGPMDKNAYILCQLDR